MPDLSEDVYRHYYEREFITPTEITNLILGNDPRVKYLKYRHSGYKALLEKITYKFKCKSNTDIPVKEIFNWAIKKIPDFNEKLPKNLIINTITSQCHSPASQCAGYVVSTPFSRDELEEKYLQAMSENNKLTKIIENLNCEIIRLSVFERQRINKQQAGKIGGESCKNSSKNY